MTKLWSSNAAQYLVRLDLCPRCDVVLRSPGFCWNCRAELSAADTAGLDTASHTAADAILARQALIDALPTRPLEPVARPAAASAAAPAGATVASIAAVAVVAPTGEGSQVSVQSVLAVVGAALLAVAAIVFTFFNPDLTDFAVRTTIVAVTTAVFLGGALLLNRVKLHFSAEAVGALGMVFVALDVYAFADKAPASVSSFVFVGIGTAVSAVVLIAVATLVRLRTWLWLGLLGLVITPAWFGYAFGTEWGAIVGHLGVGVVALGVYELAGWLGTRFGKTLHADRAMATVLGIIVVGVIFVQLFFTLDANSRPGLTATLFALAILAALGTRNQIPAVWSVLSGIFFLLGSASVVQLWPANSDDYWTFASIAFAALAGLVVFAAILRPSRLLPGLRRSAALVSALIVVGLALIPVFSVSLVNETSAFRTPSYSRLPVSAGLASTIALLAVTASLVALWFLIRGGQRRIAITVALCFGVAALLDFAAWSAFTRTQQVIAGEVIALGLGLVVILVLARRGAPARTRIPLVVGAHVILVFAASLAWGGPALSIAGGTAAVAILGALAFTVPRVARPAYAGIGFAYALLIFWHGMNLADVGTIAALSLTASLGSVAALGATLVRRIPVRHWYAVLIVTAVPFLIGVISVLIERSGWTALSTGVTFSLALTLLLTRRPGLNRYLRAVAAGLLVPTIAVVIVSFGAQYILVSASPITLSIIAVIVACTLASTELIRGGLVKHGFSEADARLVRLWIEVSTLVTAVLAELLALVRAAAGLHTSVVVLLILGIGAAAAAFTTHRRYAWPLAAASWTGALWSVWGIFGIQVLEPYILPPAIGAAIVGAIFVVRKSPGLGLYSVGLACGILPTLLVLAVSGNGGVTPWRTIGLLGGAVILVLIGAIASRRPIGSGFGILGTPTLVAGIVAAAAGTVQAVRIAWSLDTGWTSPTTPALVPALFLGGAACIIAGIAARFLVTPARVAQPRWRWVYMPAVLYLALSAITAMRSNPGSTWTLWTLTLVLLGVMIATALRAQHRPTALPPAWFMIAIAWCTAVSGWSSREVLRVEGFSLPLGLALLAVGIIGMRGAPVTPEPGRSLNSWPVGFSGSWPLLAPGIALTVLPSIIATGTDPVTWRAILVISLSLVAILIGSLRKYGAPFILGIAALPIENIVVFAVQAGHRINATSWWITLASAGAVLLVIAVTYERRTSGDRGIAARMRDLK